MEATQDNFLRVLPKRGLEGIGSYLCGGINWRVIDQLVGGGDGKTRTDGPGNYQRWGNGRVTSQCGAVPVVDVGGSGSKKCKLECRNEEYPEYV